MKTRVFVPIFFSVSIFLVSCFSRRFVDQSSTNDSNSLSQGLKIVSLEPLLRAHKIWDLATQWKAKIWIGRLPKAEIVNAETDITWYSYGAFYEDTDGNGKMNPADNGFFEPGSTVKVLIAATYLEKNMNLQITNAVRNHLQNMLVVSDNEAANEIISQVGFEAINATATRRNISNLIVSRFMLKPRGDFDWGCHETEGVPGNCASAQALSGVMLRLVRPEWFVTNERFQISDDRRNWVLQTMGVVPAALGYSGASDESCRLLQRSYVALAKFQKLDAVYAKCGISPKSNHWTEMSYIKTAGTVDLVAVFSVSGADRAEEEIYEALNHLAAPVFDDMLSQ